MRVCVCIIKRGRREGGESGRCVLLCYHVKLKRVREEGIWVVCMWRKGERWWGKEDGGEGEGREKGKGFFIYFFIYLLLLFFFPKGGEGAYHIFL